MVAEVSMRHFPDISDTSLDQDFSESSFQIPIVGGSNDLLMDEDSMDFLHNANETLSTPLAPRHTQSRTRAPLTLQDLTPRSTRTRPTPVRSSLRPRPRPAIATPFRAALAKNISDALCEDISSAPRQDLSFQIPTAAAQGTDSLLDTHNNFSLSDCADITLSTDQQQLCSALPGPLTLSQLSPQLNESLSEHPSPSNSQPTPEHAAAELPQTRAGSISTSTDEAQGAEALTMQEIPSEPKVGEQHPMPHAEPDQAAAKTSEESMNSMASTAKQGTRRVSDTVKRRKPTVLHGGITKTKAKVPKPTISVSRAVSARTVSARTAKPPAITRARSRVNPSNAQSKQLGTANPIKPGDAQKSKVLSDDGGSSAVGGLASTLMSYGLRLADSHDLASSTSQQATEPAPGTNLTVTPVVTASTSKPTGPDTPGTDADADAGVGTDASEGQGQVERPVSRSASPEAYRDTDRRTDLPLTLSQLSPTKDAPAPARPRQGRAPARPPSPTRPPTKRPQSATSSGAASSSQNKRSKTERDPEQETRARAWSSSSQRSQEGRGRAPGARGASRSRAPPPSNVHVRHPSADQAAKAKTDACASLNARERAAPGPSTSRSSANAEEDGKSAVPRQLTGTRSGADAIAGGSRSGGPTTSRDSHKQNRTTDGKARPPASAEGDHAHGPTPTFERPASALPPAKPTKPIEFHFHSDARIEARKAEFEKSAGGGTGSMGHSKSRSHAQLPIPDFKAMHAAQEAAHAARREHIVPVVPQEVGFPTDVRAKERERFDEARRAREREIEVQMEERRRLREIEEEKEIKELRRRAVPKANEVPEWYADAPKRTGRAKS